MKAIKFLVAAMAMSFAMSANAKIFEDNHLVVNANVGGITNNGVGDGAFGFGVGFQTGVYENDWISLAWDVIHFEWNAPFDSPKYWDYLNFKSGIRAFSPSFANDHLRAYTNFALGYTCVLAKGWYADYDWDDDEIEYESEMKGHSAFGLTWGLGLQLNKKWSFGYTLEYETWAKTKCHFGTVSYSF